MYLLYSLAYIVALIFLLPFQYLKRPKELRRQWFREKFGFFDSSLLTPHSSLIWVHAVSVGEIMAALPMLKRLREGYPSKGIILSTITDTGQKVAREGAPEGTTVLYLPFDITFIFKAVLRRVRPEILITIETELWPNIFRVFKKYGIPVILLNGRISENSFRGYKKISFFMKRVLSHVDLFCMQSEVDAERINSLGVDERRIKVLGNFKFDTRPPSEIPFWTEKIKGPVIVAGSTHGGEEELMTSVYSELKKDFPDINLILAPRHPERFKEVEELLRSKGLSFVKRSEISRLMTPDLRFSGTIILLDSVGELSAIYGMTDIAIIGKSFKGYGGQNPLEPAYWGKPILCGPHMENFPFIKDFYSEGAALEVNEEGLYPKLRELLLSPERAKEIGLKAQQLYRKNTGAVEKAMEIIAGYIN
ncbi:MAG: 3-deoxy-D-manno-octulosonic acid transferase [Thermodesulfovibrionales bacterium]|nr:3-deoxy-D-manno-octulosonic acid transferase [Thermodesulfovibrionales bacterium]